MALCAGRGRGARHRKFYEGLTDELCQLVRSAVLAPSFEVDPPAYAEYLWQWFLSVHQGRQEGFSGPQALTWRDMGEWASVTRAAPSTMEWRALRAMDAAWLAACRELNAQTGDDPKHTQSERPMTAELFDAIF